MKTLARLILCAITFLSAIIAAAEPAVRRCEPWQAEYTGDDATGPQVLGLWQWEGSEPQADSSGRGYAGRLQGAAIYPQGRFGACLESKPGWPVEDASHRLLVANDPRLTPKGAFSLEMWICPKPELADYPESFLIDKKYVDHNDYQLILGEADRSGARVLRAVLGFGQDSSTRFSRSLMLKTGEWRHIAFTYDGAGMGRFFLDGMPWGSTEVPGRGQVTPGRHGLSIGDRVGSYYHGFPGYLDQVRLCDGAREYRRAALEPLAGRRVFRRMEPDATLRLALTNFQASPIEEGTVGVSLGSGGEKEFSVVGLVPGQSQEIVYQVDAALRPDIYRVVARLQIDRPEPYTSEEEFTVQLMPRPVPEEFPVLMWGIYGGVEEEVDRLKEIGFTHVLGLGADFGKIWEAGQASEPDTPERIAQARRSLDTALASGLTVAASLSPGAAMRSRDSLLRVDRDGKPVTDREDICGLLPELAKYCENVGSSVARAYGDHPAFGAALLHTEVRDHARPCFHEHDFAAFRQRTGLEVPAEVTGSSRGVDYAKLPGFPADRVIADNHPLYRYFQWYWKEGDGWNALNTAVHRGLKSPGRADLWTFHDPAVRVASVYGSGGDVDVLSQWTYSYPDPIRIGLATDELLAMARGASKPQQVMKMTQVIWYRSQTAPPPKRPEDALPYQARWEREQPDAPFITIAPMHLREAFWTKIARPIQGIMYHGWQSLVPTDSPGGYRYTNPETQHELARLIRTVARPLGPALRRMPAARSDVAFLKCFAAEMFARRGTYGWGGGWAGDLWHVLAYAHLQPEIVFDETVIAPGGLNGFRVLVMPDCDVITRRMADAIQAFQQRGGLVIGDERLAPAIRPDLVLPIYQRTGRADQDKAALQKLAADLRGQLDAKYVRYVDTSKPDLIPYVRRDGASDYVFVVNDRREYGDYVGQHGIVMENGLPAEGRLSIARPSGFLYDLVEHRLLPARSAEGRLEAQLSLGPCEGRLLLATDRSIEAVRIVGDEKVERGQPIALNIEVVDAEGRPIQAVVPLRVSIRDSGARQAEFSGPYAAVAGRLIVRLDIAPNDTPGVWQIEVQELASGRQAASYFRVAGPQPWPPSPPPPSKELANPVQPKG